MINKLKCFKMNYELIVAYWGLYLGLQSIWRIRNKFATSIYIEFNICKYLLYHDGSDAQFYTISIILQRWAFIRMTDYCIKKVEYLLELKAINRIARVK